MAQGDAPVRRRNFYGRRFGKTLRPGQRELVRSALPLLSLPGATREANPERVPLPAEVVPRPLWLEIGIGAGEHLLALAAANPGVTLLGCEMFVNGIAACLAHHAGSGLGNVILHHGDARDLMEVLPAASVDRAFLLYPDPWPKRRHAGRRFVNPEGRDLLARVLAPGARFHLATDMPGYVTHSLAVMAARGDFLREPHPPESPWPDWHRTRYEAKAVREGRVPNYLTFVRV
jgi:tRNA (guanine-N7-)-methyltransferase